MNTLSALTKQHSIGVCIRVHSYMIGENHKYINTSTNSKKPLNLCFAISGCRQSSSQFQILFYITPSQKTVLIVINLDFPQFVGVELAGTEFVGTELTLHRNCRHRIGWHRINAAPKRWHRNGGTEKVAPRRCRPKKVSH